MQQSSRTIAVPESRDGQRLDNFLNREMKGLPRSRIYNLIRTGQVRVNSRRAKPAQKLETGDMVRIPPAHLANKNQSTPPETVIDMVRDSVLFNGQGLLVLNKPAGLAVHGGSGLGWGLIDAARIAFSSPELDLAHRLDRETSGVLVLAYDRHGLNRVQQHLQQDEAHKTYLALLCGQLADSPVEVNLPLAKTGKRAGERLVQVDHEEGKAAHSVFTRLQQYKNTEFAEVKITTGRTHQIRVHAQALGNPVAGDSKYGDKDANRELRALGLKSLFLHAQCLDIPLKNGETLPISAPLPENLRMVLDVLT